MYMIYGLVYIEIKSETNNNKNVYDLCFSFDFSDNIGG